MTEMTKVKICTAVIFLIGSGPVVSAMDLTKWKYYFPVTLEDKPSEYCRMDITPELYNSAKRDMSDIRIVDSKGRQVPYVLEMPQDTVRKQDYSPTVINRSSGAGNSSLVTVDFGGQIVKNSIEVRTGGSNFRRAVKIEGSNDNIAFFTLVEQAFVFAVDNRERSRFSDIDLPLNDYRYLRITVEPMTAEEKSPVIDYVKVSQHEREPAARTPVQAEMAEVKHTEDEVHNLSIYEYDLRFCNLPIHEIKLSVAEESFYRPITLEGRDVLTRKIKIDSEDNRERFREIDEPWVNLTGSAIYRYVSAEGKKHERTTVPLYPGISASRYLRVTIRNYDDTPLTLGSASAEMIAHKIVFAVPEKSEKLCLYAGCESASRPRYDIAYKLTNPLDVLAVAGELGSIAENPLFGKVEPKPVPWTEKHKTLLKVVMIMVVLVLGGFIVKSFASIQTGTGD